LDTVTADAAAAGVRPPAVIVIGPVAGLAPEGNHA
jgi:uroporphyrin-III C-methyltransferase/precorrin-2 dehydrogenase/sirohydrochlorin ferrochelatase